MSLLSIEWLKLKRYRTFWIIAGLFALFYILLVFGISGGLVTFGIFNLGSSVSFAEVWNYNCFYASHFVIILAVLVVIITSNEYQYRTNRQNVIDGWTRLNFYHAKWQVIILMAVATALFSFIVGLCSGLMSGASFSGIGDGIQNVGYLFILSLNYFGFAYMLTLLLKRGGLTIALLLLYYMIAETILHLILFYKYKFFAGDFFLPLQSSDELLPFPTLKSLDKMASQGSVLPPAWAYIIASCCWITVYYFGGRLKLKGNDW